MVDCPLAKRMQDVGLARLVELLGVRFGGDGDGAVEGRCPSGGHGFASSENDHGIVPKSGVSLASIIMAILAQLTFSCRLVAVEFSPLHNAFKRVHLRHG